MTASSDSSSPSTQHVSMSSHSSLGSSTSTSHSSSLGSSPSTSGSHNTHSSSAQSLSPSPALVPLLRLACATLGQPPIRM
ncbi:unnamed protein product [Linum trigynum]|uniref:REJ domain-containing protein n=1 Tax=Linum trigynum TaxID=586398 RepID=A0AAV2F6S1_9ROSI